MPFACFTQLRSFTTVKHNSDTDKTKLKRALICINHSHKNLTKCLYAMSPISSFSVPLVHWLHNITHFILDGTTSFLLHKLNLRRPCRHRSIPPLMASRQRYDSVKWGRWRCSMFAVAVPKVIVRWKIIGDGIQWYMCQMMAHRQTGGNMCWP